MRIYKRELAEISYIGIIPICVLWQLIFFGGFEELLYLCILIETRKLQS